MKAVEPRRFENGRELPCIVAPLQAIAWSNHPPQNHKGAEQTAGKMLLTMTILIGDDFFFFEEFLRAQSAY
jgi:hypothetical protein